MLTAAQREELQEIKGSCRSKKNVMWTQPLRAFVLNLVKEHRLLLGERRMEGYQRLANELDHRGEQAKSAIGGRSLSKKVLLLLQEVEGLDVPILPWHLAAKALSKQLQDVELVHQTQCGMKAVATQELDAIESDLLPHPAPPPSSNAHLFVERQGPSHTNDDDEDVEGDEDVADDDENDNKPMECKPSTLGKRPREPIEKSSNSDVSENSDESPASYDFEDAYPTLAALRSSPLQRGSASSNSAPAQKSWASSRHGPVNEPSTAKKQRRELAPQSISLSDADEELVDIMKDAAGKLKESDSSSLQGVVSSQATMIENLQRIVDKKEKQFRQLQAATARYFTALQRPIPQDLMKPLFPSE